MRTAVRASYRHLQYRHAGEVCCCQKEWIVAWCECFREVQVCEQQDGRDDVDAGRESSLSLSLGWWWVYCCCRLWEFGKLGCGGLLR
jgi:hypothetical protein